jgi:dienelactone hydrolase
MKVFLPVLLTLLLAGTEARASVQQVSFPLRGKVLDLTIYLPNGRQPRGTVFVGSGDVGWVGLGVDIAEFLADQGYCAVGINVRQYLGTFTSGKSTMTTAEPPGDYAALAEFLRKRGTFWEPVIVSGVSEGAALAVLAASSQANHRWIRGVITFGLPPTAEIAWRWSDFTAWITKKDPNEPMFAPKDFIAQVSPLPLCMIQSTRDEYVTEADYKLFERTAREPKRLVLIAASNHRFTDRKKELKDELLKALAWIAQYPQ